VVQQESENTYVSVTATAKASRRNENNEAQPQVQSQSDSTSRVSYPNPIQKSNLINPNLAITVKKGEKRKGVKECGWKRK